MYVKKVNAPTNCGDNYEKKALLREIVLFMRFFLMVGIALLFLIADGIVVLFL